jgi:predicted dehydrogenase
MKPIVFGLIGGGWRSQFYLRIARELPELFKVGGMVIRDKTKGKELEEKWGVKTFPTIDSLIENVTFSFVVISVPSSVTPELLVELTNRDIPVLAETPPAPDLESLIRLNQQISNDHMVQVAEQFAFQPKNASLLSIVESGKIGSVRQVQISVAHGYHGISLMRKLLGISYDNAVIHAYPFVSPLVNGPNRQGPPKKEAFVQSEQTIATFHFDDKLGIYDFTGDQYFSLVRSPRLLIRGEKGEINNNQISYLKEFDTPIYLDLKRVDAGENGNLEGYYHKGFLIGEDWTYRNPFIPGRLTDEEIAIATCLEKMDSYVKGGPSFYSLGEASQDQYLSLMINKAVESKSILHTTQHDWTRDE